VTEEIKLNSKVKFKESDLFRVYQSIDLGNLQSDSPEHQDQLPQLLKLKAALYSSDYRAFIERIANLPRGTLTDQVDCAANCHAPGCHLLCHDDVIGTRRISYIVYLTEPHWSAEEGGALELYSPETTEGVLDTTSPSARVPQATPTKTLLPLFNSMAYFEVQPGISFHAVQEVFGERPRLSIQGWYHAADIPLGIEDATLNRLKTIGKGEDTEGEFDAFLNTAPTATTATTIDNGTAQLTETNDTLSEADCAFLKTYVNETCLSAESMQEIRERFEQDSSVQLRHFLCKPFMTKIEQKLKSEEDLGNGKPALDYLQFQSPKDTNGNHSSFGTWTVVGPAHKQRFLEFSESSDSSNSSGGGVGDDMGSLLLTVKEQLFQRPEFGRFLKSITSLGMPTGHRGRVRRFRPGLDYTVAHYGILTTQSVLDATLCLCAGNGEQCRVDEETGDLVGTDADAVWASGDCGGFECYIAAENDDDEAEEAAADEYNDEDDTELLSVSASNNTLSLVYRDPGTMRFVKYVGCRAPSSRWDVSMEYEVEDTGDDGDEDDGEEIDGESEDEEAD
jgi:prolyl 3-hydroxylase /prolyl 3,4-dihydroxylase